MRTIRGALLAVTLAGCSGSTPSDAGLSDAGPRDAGTSDAGPATCPQYPGLFRCDGRVLSCAYFETCCGQQVLVYACRCSAPSVNSDGCSTYDDPRCVTGVCPDAGSGGDGGADAGDGG